MPSILQYIIVESTTIGLLMLHRTSGSERWITQALIEGDVLCIYEAGIEIPVLDFYESVDLEDSPAGS